MLVATAGELLTFQGTRMRASRPIFAIPVKVYTHFAVITLAITMCVAIFADGKGRKHLQEQVIEREARKAKLNEQVTRIGNRRMVSGLADNRTSASGYDNADTAPDLAQSLPASSIRMSDPSTSPWSNLSALPDRRSSARKKPASTFPADTSPDERPNVAPEPPPLPIDVPRQLD